MNINIDVEDIDKINSRKLHELTMTQESTIQLLQNLKLLLLKLGNAYSCLKRCNNWHMGKSANREDGMFT